MIQRWFNRPNGAGDSDIWVTTRPTIDEDWEEPVNLGRTVNSTFKEENPCISADGLELYFASNRKGGYLTKSLASYLDFDGKSQFCIIREKRRDWWV